LGVERQFSNSQALADLSASHFHSLFSLWSESLSPIIAPMHPMTEDDPVCALCERQVPRHLITQHHLTPRQKGGKAQHRTPLCKPCHKQLHATWSNTELAKLYDRIDLLRAAPQLQPFLKWICKQKPNRNFRTIMSNAHPQPSKGVARRKQRFSR
jgi:5-methylcytosine-specific restriction enzyme A